MKSTYEIHELIVEGIMQNSPDMEPFKVSYPAGHEIPEGSYVKSPEGVWVRIEE